MVHLIHLFNKSQIVGFLFTWFILPFGRNRLRNCYDSKKNQKRRNICYNAVHYILTGDFENHIFFILRNPVELPRLHTFGEISYTDNNNRKQAYRSNETPDCRTCPDSNNGVIICGIVIPQGFFIFITFLERSQSHYHTSY